MPRARRDGAGEDPVKSMRRSGLLPVFSFSLVVLCGCGSMTQIRVENISTRDFTNVSIAGQAYGDIAPGEMSDYKGVKLKFRYAALKLHVDGRYVTGQTLTFGAKRFTYRIGVKDFDAGYLAIDMIREGQSATAPRQAHGD